MSAYLDAVSKAKQRYVAAKITLEQRLRTQLKEEMHSLQTQVDIAVRYAFDNHSSKADIMRALGTKDYHTVYASLDRTKHIEEITGENPLDSVYSYDPETKLLEVTYVNHGPKDITGTASFKFAEFDDGKKFFLSQTALWNDDYTERNGVVAALDQTDSGHYYDEALVWLSGKL